MLGISNTEILYQTHQDNIRAVEGSDQPSEDIGQSIVAIAAYSYTPHQTDKTHGGHIRPGKVMLDISRSSKLIHIKLYSQTNIRKSSHQMDKA